MKIAIGGDHGGFHLKNILVDQLKRLGHDVHDCGATKLDPGDDYPDFAESVCRMIQRTDVERGIIICGSGVGASVAANKMHDIRAAICHDTFSAQQGVEDDNMNVLCLGGRVIGESLALELVTTFLSANFSGIERHVRRLEKVANLEFEKRDDTAQTSSDRHLQEKRQS